MPTPTASEIIERVKARYEGCRSYEDTGTISSVRTQGTTADRWKDEQKAFRTNFVRPHEFLFELMRGTSRSSEEVETGVGMSAKGVFVREVGGVPKFARELLPRRFTRDGYARSSESLRTEVMLQVGKPGFAFMLQDLLSPDSAGEVALGDFVPASMRSATKEGVDGLLIEGKWMYHSAYLLVDPSWFSIRRWYYREQFDENYRALMVEDIERKLASTAVEDRSHPHLVRLAESLRRETHNHVTEHTTIINPRMDHAIDPSVFEFTPPR